jgi:CDP-diglyceride synthetase
MATIISLIFVGILLEIVNSLMLKLTIKEFTKNKKTFLILISFFTRMLMIAIVFYIFLDKKWENAILMLLGLTISKIFFIILTKLNLRK